MTAAGRHKWLALALLCVVQFMVILDIAIVNVALPSIQVDLGFSQENLQWVISAYALVFGGFLLLGGRLADLLGRRRVFMLGLVIFTVGSLLCGLAWSEGSLIAARALQGLGAAIVSPAALSILTTTFREGRERNIALGAWGAVGGVRRRRRRPVRRHPGRVPLAGSGSSSSTCPSGSPPWPSRRSCSRRAATSGSRASTSSAPSSSRPGSAFSCSGSRKGRTGAGRRARRSASSSPAAVLLLAFIGAGVPHPASADAALDLPPPDAHRRQHRHVHHGHGAVLDVPDALALHGSRCSSSRR